MENTLYDYSPITERPPITWPDGKKLAFYVGLNIEYFHVDMAGDMTHPTLGARDPNPMSYARRDYGPRVGIWRMIDLFDRCGVRASAITNWEVVHQHPQIIDAGIERNWAWIGHGRTNSLLHNNMTEHEEAAALDELGTAFNSVGIHPRGWLGPALTETFATPKLLRERGFDYLLDWVADDRPFPLNVPGMISVPYSLDINDIDLYVGKATTGHQYEQIVMDQFDILLHEGGGVMALPVHPFVVGQPYRFKYLSCVIETITSHPDVWVTTSDDIADHFTTNTNELEDPVLRQPAQGGTGFRGRWSGSTSPRSASGGPGGRS